MPSHVERRLTAIMATDVVGYSRMVEADEAGALAALRDLRRNVLEPLLAEHRGRLVKLMGDGLIAEFGSVVAAVSCAAAIQARLAESQEQVSPERRTVLRIGVNLGDVVVEGDDLLGDGVNVAARLEQACPPGGILISGAAYDQLSGKLDVGFEPTGELRLKNIARPVRAYRMMPDGVPALGAAAIPLTDRPSIAVLPFVNMSGDPEQEYFADGIVEDIITALSRFGWLFVIARNSSFTYKGKAVDVKQVGRELGVRYVLEGSVRKSSNRVRIAAQLIEAATGAHLWADRFEGSLEDVFDLQDQVTASVVGAVEPKLQRAEIELARRKPPERLDAYDCHLRAMASLYRLTRDSLTEARQLFHRAIELDPDYAAPYGMAAWTVHLFRTNGWMDDPAREIDEGRNLARRATALGRDDPTALWSGGFALAYLAGEVETGAAHVDRALVLNPNAAAAWDVSGWLRIYLGHPDDAIECFARAMRLSPLDSFFYFGCTGMAFAHICARRFEEAASWATRATHEQANWAATWRIAAIAYALSDRMPEAQAAIARMREIDPDLRISTYLPITSPFRRSEDRNLCIEALQRAGLPA